MARLKIYEDRLAPNALAEIREWAEEPELSKLLRALEAARDGQRFLDIYAEAMIARHLRRFGHELYYEVETTANRMADFRVKEGNADFFLHVKRLGVDKESQKETAIHRRLRDLKRIKRGILLGTVFFKRVTDAEMQGVYQQLKRFCEDGRSGERLTLLAGTGKVVGESTIEALDRANSVRLITTMAVRVGDDVSRLYKKLSDGYKQFMPGARNIILVTSIWKDDVEEFQEALLGEGGFWANGKHSDSEIVGWFNFGTKEDYIDFRMWYREGCEVPRYVRKIFEGKT